MKTVLYIVMGTAAVLFLVMLGVQWWLGSRLRRAAEKEVADRTGGAVQLRIGGVGINLLRRAVTLSDVSLAGVPEQLGKWLPGVDSVGAEIGRIAVRGIRFRLRGADKHLSVGSLEIDSAHVSVVTVAADTLRQAAGESWRERLAEAVGTLAVKRIGIRCADFQVARTGRNSYKTRGLNLEAEGFRLAPEGTDQRPLFCDDVRLTVGKASVRFVQTAQLLEADSLDVGLTAGTLSLSNVRLIPQLPKAEYAWKVPRHTDWTQVIVGGLRAKGIDYGLLWRDTMLKVDTLTLEDVEVASYKNRRIVRKERFKPTLSEMVKRVPFGLEVGTAEIVNAHVVYEELAATGERPGRISFDGLNGVFAGLTNRPDSTDFFYTLSASGKVMNAGLLHVVARFPAHASNDRFEVEGTLGPVNLKVFNRILEPLADAGVRTGHIDGMKFSIMGDHRAAEVEMEMRYDDLSVALLRGMKDGRRTERTLMSGIVNTMLIRSSNPDRKGLRVVRHRAERDTTRSQFNYLWRTLLAGIRGSVGFPGAKKDRIDESVGD